jgi:hypothetical protein
MLDIPTKIGQFTTLSEYMQVNLKGSLNAKNINVKTLDALDMMAKAKEQDVDIKPGYCGDCGGVLVKRDGAYVCSSCAVVDTTLDKLKHFFGYRI